MKKIILYIKLFVATRVYSALAPEGVPDDHAKPVSLSRKTAHASREQLLCRNSDGFGLAGGGGSCLIGWPGWKDRQDACYQENSAEKRKLGDEMISLVPSKSSSLAMPFSLNNDDRCFSAGTEFSFISETDARHSCDSVSDDGTETGVVRLVVRRDGVLPGSTYAIGRSRARVLNLCAR